MFVFKIKYKHRNIFIIIDWFIKLHFVCGKLLNRLISLQLVHSADLYKVCTFLHADLMHTFSLGCKVCRKVPARADLART